MAEKLAGHAYNESGSNLDQSDGSNLKNLSKLQKRVKPVYTRTPKVYDPFRNVNYFKKRKVLPEVSSGPLNLLLEKYGLDKKMLNYDFIRFWPEIVGEGIAKYATPGSFKDGLLVVNVTDSSWAQELNFQKNVIKSRLNVFLKDRSAGGVNGSQVHNSKVKSDKAENEVRDIYFSVVSKRGRVASFR